MLNFLRKLRRLEMKKSNYLKYAIGEIFLVMIGILLALTINNWNEHRKDRNYSITLLSEIHNSLVNDSVLVDLFFLPRLAIKQEGIDSLMLLSYNKSHVHESVIQRQFDKIFVEFLYRFDKGPYEALKQNGLDKVTNDELRKALIDNYEQKFPAFKQFIDSYDNYYDPIIRDEFQRINKQEVISENGILSIEDRIKVPNVLQHASFLKVLKLQQQKADNSRNRLNSLILLNREFRSLVESELKQLNR